MADGLPKLQTEDGYDKANGGKWLLAEDGQAQVLVRADQHTAERLAEVFAGTTQAATPQLIPIGTTLVCRRKHNNRGYDPQQRQTQSKGGGHTYTTNWTEREYLRGEETTIVGYRNDSGFFYGYTLTPLRHETEPLVYQASELFSFFDIKRDKK